jgi:hypothetical protein
MKHKILHFLFLKKFILGGVSKCICGAVNHPVLQLFGFASIFIHFVMQLAYSSQIKMLTL